MPVCMDCCYTPVLSGSCLQDLRGDTPARTVVLFNVSSEQKRLALFHFFFDEEPAAGHLLTIVRRGVMIRKQATATKLWFYSTYPHEAQYTS